MNYFNHKYTLLLFLIVASFSQVCALSPNREVRGTWLTTVWRIDWPSEVITKTGNQNQIQVQKKQMIRILDSLKVAKLNLVYFQVRGRSDAMYQSSYEPWSSDLVATRGMDPGYDPLAFTIEEGHKRGIEVYAWVNPYRFESATGAWAGMEGDYATTHPDWVLSIRGASILNPGMPEVRKHVTSIIAEIVHNYDIDGVIFDDYFYLSGIKQEDLLQQQQYNTTGLSVADWRRQNVNKLVKQVYDTIQVLKPYVKFGIGPAGIYGGGSKTEEQYNMVHPAGIGSGFAYDSIYCDALAWLQGGYIDFISPQIYWPIGSGSTAYEVICEWWGQIAHKFNRHCYTSQSLSAMAPSPEKVQQLRANMENSDLNGLSQIEKMAYLQQQALQVEDKISASRAPQKVTAAYNFGFNEICNQIDCNRRYDLNGAPGSVFFSTKSFLYQGNSVNYIGGKMFPNPVLTPAIFWKENDSDVTIENIALNNNTLTWNCNAENMRYAIYAIEKAVTPLTTHLIGMSYQKEYTIPTIYLTSSYELGVAPFDRYGNEGVLCMQNIPSGKVESTTLLYPASQSIMDIPSYFTWNKVDADQYFVEISEDASFDKLFDVKMTTNTQVGSTRFYPFLKGKNYYWRVRSRKLGKTDGLSAIQSFTIQNFDILTPVSGTDNLSQTPTITWSGCPFDLSYTLDIATTRAFGSDIIFSQTVKGTNCQVPEALLKTNTTYYARIKVTLDDYNAYSSVIDFKTLYREPAIPTILSPTEQETCVNNTVCINWAQESAASGFRVEICMNKQFPTRDVTAQRKEVDAFHYSADFSGLQDGVWYLRARSNYSSTYTGWTPVRSFIVDTTNGIKQLSMNNRPYLMRNLDGTIQLVFSPAEYMPIHIDIYTIAGEKIGSEPTTYYFPGDYIYSLKDLQKGIYLIKIQMKDKHFDLKLVR